MNVIAEFHVEADQLLLGRTLSALPGTEIELEQHTANERGRPIFFLWLDGNSTNHRVNDGHDERPPTGDEPESSGGIEWFERALTADETVAEATVIDEADGRQLYRVVFTTTCFYGVYRDTAGKILRLVGSQDGWTGRIRFPDREGIRTFRRHFAERDIVFRVERLYEESESDIQESAMTPLWERDLGLTEPQRATVLAALAAGYYDDPRTSGIETLAEEFDVSPQAIAGRLRRAHRNIVENTLAVDTGGLNEQPDDRKRC